MHTPGYDILQTSGNAKKRGQSVSLFELLRSFATHRRPEALPSAPLHHCMLSANQRRRVEDRGSQRWIRTPDELVGSKRYPKFCVKSKGKGELTAHRVPGGMKPGGGP